MSCWPAPLLFTRPAKVDRDIQHLVKKKHKNHAPNLHRDLPSSHLLPTTDPTGRGSQSRSFLRLGLVVLCHLVEVSDAGRTGDGQLLGTLPSFQKGMLVSPLPEGEFTESAFSNATPRVMLQQRKQNDGIHAASQ